MLNRNDHIPLKTQLEEIFRTNIEEGIWLPNQQILSENEFSRQFGISRMTVRNVIIKLVQEGLLYTVPGKGTYVGEPKLLSRPLWEMGLCGQLEEQGVATVTKVLSCSLLPAPDKIAQKLQLKQQTPIWEIKRVRFVRNKPLSLHIAYINQADFPGLADKDLVGRQLCHIIEEDYHFPIIRINETIEIKKADSFESEVLDIPYEEPLLLIDETVFTDDEKPIEVTTVCFKGDKIRFQINR